MDLLVERARTGDAAALEELLASVAPSVHRFGLRMCKSPHDAEDALQDTLLSIATHLGEFQGRSSFTSWVFALTRSACSRRRRGLKNQPTVSDEAAPEQADESPSPEERVADRELADALSRALEGLTEEQREVIVLRDMEGLSAVDAAASLELSVDALKSRLHRAREALRIALRPVLEPLAPPPSTSCPDVAALWSQKLEGDLDQRDCKQMEAHLATCPACGAACDALRKALLVCRSSASPVVRPEVQRRVKAAVRAWVAQVKA